MAKAALGTKVRKNSCWGFYMPVARSSANLLSCWKGIRPFWDSRSFVIACMQIFWFYVWWSSHKQVEIWDPNLLRKSCFLIVEQPHLDLWTCPGRDERCIQEKGDRTTPDFRVQSTRANLDMLTSCLQYQICVLALSHTSWGITFVEPLNHFLCRAFERLPLRW